MTGKRFVLVLALFGLFAFSLGCTDDLTQRTLNKTVDLGGIDLASKANPECGAMTSVEDLVMSIEGYENWIDDIKNVKIRKVLYKVTNNNTPGDVEGQFWMTDPGSIRTIVLVGAGTIPAMTDVPDWTTLPFYVEGEYDGADTVQYFIDNYTLPFDWCAAGDPDTDVSMTIWISLDLAITIDLV